MADIESRVRDIIVNELGVEPSKVTLRPLSSRTSAQTRSTLWSS